MKMPKPSIPEPPRIAKLPHYKGIPITATTDVDPTTGIPNFKSIDNNKVWEFKRDRKCGICGEPLDYWIAFMVTEDEATSQHIYESPQHKECLEYAFEICPWLYYSKAMYTTVEGLDDITLKNVLAHPDRIAAQERPSKLGIYICRDYQNVILKAKLPGHPSYRVCKVPPAKSLIWIDGK